MVSASVNRSAAGVSDTLMEMDIMGIAAIVSLTTGGLFIAQELSDFVLPMLDMPADPSAPTELGAAALTKVVGAFLTVMAATRFAGGQTMMMVAGLLGVGMLASAGLDVFDIVQRGGLPGSSPSSSGSSDSSSQPTPSRSPSKSATVSPASRDRDGSQAAAIR